MYVRIKNRIDDAAPGRIRGIHKIGSIGVEVRTLVACSDVCF